MAKHRADPRTVLTGRRRYLFTLSFVVLALVLGLASSQTLTRGHEQQVANSLAFLPFVAAAFATRFYGSRLDVEALRPIVEIFFKLAAVTFVGVVLVSLNQSLATPNIAAGSGIFLAGLIAIGAWTLLAELVYKSVAAYYESSRSSAS